MWRRIGWCVLGSACMALSAHVAQAITVDGKLDVSYTLLSTQTTQTSPGPDAASGQADFATGSELDAAWAAVDQGVLYLFFAGNLKDTICGTQACSDIGVLEVFIDSQPGGQNQLLGNSPAGLPIAGLTFDPGFAPDYVVEFYPGGALDNSFRRFAQYGTLPTGGGGASVFLGSGTNPGAPGTLSGGTNPFGIQATIDNSNTGGVTAGCLAGSGAGVSTGVELAIPLAGIGNPGGCLTVNAIALNPVNSTATNQVLGPVPPGTCSLGAPSAVNFAGIPGDQFFSVCPGATPARRSTWGGVKAVYR